MVFFMLTAAATLTVLWALPRTAPQTAATRGSLAVVPATALTLSGLHGVGLPAVHGGAALAGIAFGAVFQGALRLTLASLAAQDPAATLAAYYVLSYLSMSLPAIAAGAATSTTGCAPPPTPTPSPPPCSPSRPWQHSPCQGAGQPTTHTTTFRNETQRTERS
jgi:hypothetical protein